MLKMGNCEQMTCIVIFLDSLFLDLGTTPEEKKNAVRPCLFPFVCHFSTLPKPVTNAPKLLRRNQILI